MTSTNNDTVLTERGLARRIKRHLKNSTITFAAVTIPGFEAITKKEIEQLEPGCVTAAFPGIIEFTGSLELLYRVNLHCRTASRILMRISSFTARSYPELYNKLHRIHWELYCGLLPTVNITVSSRTSRLHHTTNIADTVLQSINDYLSTLSQKVAFDAESPISFHVRYHDDTCTISIDSTGVLLYKRGIRVSTGHAPLRESTAAAMLMAADWERFPVIADPCCGSGSIIGEALLMASRTAPGLLRPFSFSSWPSFTPGIWERMVAAAKVNSRPPPDRRFFAGDSDEKAVQLVRNNTELLACDTILTTACADCFTFNSKGEYGTKGLIISNLPFGKRIKTTDNDLREFHRKLGGWLRTSCRGWHYAFLVADEHFERHTGLHAATTLSFNNGGIHVRLVTGQVG